MKDKKKKEPKPYLILEEKLFSISEEAKVERKQLIKDYKKKKS